MVIDKLVTRKEAADILGVCKMTIQRMEERGEITGVTGLNRQKVYLERDILLVRKNIVDRINDKKELFERIHSKMRRTIHG